MRAVSTSERMPSREGIFWVTTGWPDAPEKNVLMWDGEKWRLTEAAADHLWGEEFSEPVISWIEEAE